MRELPTIEEPVEVLELTAGEIGALGEEVRALVAERNAVVLAHNYQVPEIQDLADFVGDSLALSRQAAVTDAELIVFCGVHFMAETASILAPAKTVLIPDLEAGCSLAESITAAELRNWKLRYPDAVVVMYVNTSAEVKAETDYCCTSGNAVQVVERVRADRGADVQILFGPDMWLGSYVELVTGKPMILWPGECHVHAGIRPEDIDRVRSERPGSELLIHPECACAPECVEYVAAGEIEDGRVHMLGTGGMLRYVSDHPGGDFIVATETGMLHPLRKAALHARLTPANPKAVCKYMKTITLPKLRDALRDRKFEVKVPADVATRARLPIERMVAIG
ncbi:MAG TPA: quinolinate synthase NadA [Solirubrobacteraceae bacterium]|nr:quinolinate synthase NadA [Solirubrobacteraceae bacterium]